jgi:hypothetical protein
MPATNALQYIQGLIEESIRSSWVAANGLFGAALAGAAMIWPGVLPLVSTDLTSVSNWILSFAIYSIGSWIVLFMASLILIAPYRSWQKATQRGNAEYAARLNVEAQLDTKDKKLRVKAVIGRYIDVGNKILGSCVGNNGNDLRMKEPAEAWVTETQRFVSAAFGSGEATLLLNDVGYTFYSSGGLVGNWVNGRIRRLNELISRVDGLAIDREFDPVPWPVSYSDKAGDV